MANYYLDSNRANQPLWNSESQDSPSLYMSFWLCISWQFSSGFKCRSGHVDSCISHFLILLVNLFWASDFILLCLFFSSNQSSEKNWPVGNIRIELLHYFHNMTLNFLPFWYDVDCIKSRHLSNKVQLFWEGHKNLRNLPHGLDIYSDSKRPNNEEDCANICDPLRKA